MLGSDAFLTGAFAVTVVFALGFVASVAVALIAASSRTGDRAIFAAIVCAVLGVLAAAATFLSLVLNVARGAR